MGLQNLIPPRFSSTHGTCAFSGGSFIVLKRRIPWHSAGEPLYRSIGTGACMSTKCSLSEGDDRQYCFYPRRLHQTEPGIANIGQHGPLVIGFLPAADNDSANYEHPVSHSSNHRPSVKWGESMIGSSSARVAVAGVGMPLSLRMLKRKEQGFRDVAHTPESTDVGNSVRKAFSSMIFILKELQSESIHIWQELFKQDMRGILNQVHQDMHTSFLWLFQQVFSCTPDLMILLMVLLSNFTAFSMANTLPAATTSSRRSWVSSLLSGSHASGLSNPDLSMQVFKERASIRALLLGNDDDQLLDSTGDGGRGIYDSCTASGGGDGNLEPSNSSDPVNRVLHCIDDNLFSEVPSVEIASQPIKASQDELLSDAYLLTDGAIASKSLSMASAFLEEEKDLMCRFFPSFVASVGASVEDDNYTCYDKTDLEYQYAMSTGAGNSMLIANYAQFLFLVRKDHDRAEEVFRRAVLCDPLDGNSISRFASFLWLGRHNVAAAGRAYQAAICADPSSTYHAADYAHFLWSSGQ